MIEINGKVYRNLQEQVGKNKEDIESIKSQLEDDELVISQLSEDVEALKGTVVSAGEGISLSEDYEISLNVEAGSGINIEQDVEDPNKLIISKEAETPTYIHNVYLDAAHTGSTWRVNIIIKNTRSNAYTTAQQLYDDMADSTYYSCSGAYYNSKLELLVQVCRGSLSYSFDFDYIADDGDTGDSSDTLNCEWVDNLRDQVL